MERMMKSPTNSKKQPKKKPKKKSKTGLYIFVSGTAFLVCLATYLLLTYKPDYQAPKIQDRAKAMALIDELRELEESKKSDRERSETSIFLQ